MTGIGKIAWRAVVGLVAATSAVGLVSGAVAQGVDLSGKTVEFVIPF
jgi:hypothetical protein